jgi:predicted esterase
MKKSLVIGLVFCINLFGTNISQEQCKSKGESFIFAGGECIEYVEFEGEIEDSLNIIVHGTWKAGTNTLARYAPFAESINMNTDITTVAVALPGYSNSSTNNFKALAHNGTKNLAAKKGYVQFVGDLVQKLKDRYEATTITYIGHSAGAMIGATLTGLKPSLINNIALAGGRYDIHEKTDAKGLVSIIDYMKTIDKSTKYLLIYGTEDKISKPKVTKDFYQIAKKQGLDVKLIEVEGAVHLDLDMTDESIEAITQMLEKE